MRIRRETLEKRTGMNPTEVQTYLSRTARLAISEGKKVVRVSRVITDANLRIRRTIDEVVIS